ncbi:MAG TPA: PSD1 and planctomycete cytochrome C domain-containing protein, partial [Planctomycetaceae bacterium]|nr:PSD1 and planctomycete cytochrome C domain-containing protein [Planctomycetaceae bacterium]
MNNFTRSCFLSCNVFIVLVSCGAFNLARSADKETAARDFTLRVQPLFKAKCLGCHGDDANDIKGKFDMRTRESLLQGGESEEPSVVPGKADESPLFHAIQWDGLEMPPKENDRLNADQIEVVRQWIADGAPWPNEDAQRKHREAAWADSAKDEGVIVKTSGGLIDDWTYRRYKREDVWAFQPLRTQEISNSGSPIDFFIDGKLEEAGVTPAPQADSLTLIRRATYDLIGLPPTPEEIAEFQVAWKQNSEQAWSDLIDRLLASPHYGERWGQHWLDVARYADTGGYSNDYERSNAWRYRNYVIRAFNNDKPYDQFVIEQLAGDELADASVKQRNGGDDSKIHATRMSGDYTEQESEWIIATGFLRMGPWDNAMITAPEARQIFLDDLVNSVGQTFLSTTMRCLKCHDHKFDPIPTRDYYRVYAAFAGTQMAERPVPFLNCENRGGFDKDKTHVERMLAFATAEKDRIVEKRETAARAWFTEHGLPYKDESSRRNLPDEEKPPRNVGLDHIDEGQLKVREQDEWIWKRCLERFEPMVQGVYNGKDHDYTWDGARKLRMPAKTNPEWKPASFILTGGTLEAQGQAVVPGVLSAPGIPVDAGGADPYTIPETLDGRRLTLAKWIVDARNPLTGRSIVNRIWQHHFVNGIARNANNFGAKGSKPTHPELLDWLAADFVEHGWTMKRLHRLIMTSEAYRIAGSHPQMTDLRTKDPDNHLLAYFPPRRLTAEELRDGLLALTGELNPQQGGLPVRPEINMEVALQPRMIQFSIAPSYQPSPTPEERNRRSIYAYRVRGQADPFMELFNLPTPNDSC